MALGRRLAAPVSAALFAVSPAWADVGRPPVSALLPTRARIEHISMRLLYINSGTLSGDIAPPAGFDGWNTIIGEGDAREPASDMLVTVRLLDMRDEPKFPPVTIEARDGRGKLVGSRIAEPGLTDRDGHTHVALWLHDIACAGKLTVTVRMGRDVARSSVALDCGE